ncbi:hypothetical protein [Sphingobium sp. LSP13-1-1.1]|uniref:hypothetical protein n=1 Tax=Sphingobium sp. LSP13-1-1.1 TaxID=3135234 RepID=UPI00342118FC
MHLVPLPADNVMPFPAMPGASRPARPSALPERPEPTWSMAAIARMLGVNHRSERWQRAYFNQLIANAHFPKPLPTMHRGELVRDVVPRRSRWLPAAVTAWIGGQLPSEAAEQLASEEATAAANRLDAAADSLFAGPLSGGDAA